MCRYLKCGSQERQFDRAPAGARLSGPLDLQPQTRAEAYAFVAETLERFDYPRRGKADKGLLRRFLVKVAGLSRAQVTRLLHQHRATTLTHLGSSVVRGRSTTCRFGRALVLLNTGGGRSVRFR